MLNGREVFAVNDHVTSGGASQVVKSNILKAAGCPEFTPGFLYAGDAPVSIVHPGEHVNALLVFIRKYCYQLPWKWHNMKLSALRFRFDPPTCRKVKVSPLHGESF
jgi:hypothetical protein